MKSSVSGGIPVEHFKLHLQCSIPKDKDIPKAGIHLVVIILPLTPKHRDCICYLSHYDIPYDC